MATPLGVNQNSNPLVDALLAALTKTSPTPQGQDVGSPALSEGIGKSIGTAMQYSQAPGTPAGDIRPIVATGQAQPTQPVQQPQQSNVRPQQGGGFNLGNFLTQLGIPLATTAVGVGIPGALPGAAGFQTGYTGELAKDYATNREINKEKKGKGVYTIDKKSGTLRSVGNVPSGAQILSEPVSTPTDFDIMKEARMTVNSMIQNNPQLQMQAFSDPSLIQNKIDEQVKVIRENLGLDTNQVTGGYISKQNNNTSDPISIKINELRQSGQYTDSQIAGFLREKGKDPSKYGL